MNQRHRHNFCYWNCICHPVATQKCCPSLHPGPLPLTRTQALVSGIGRVVLASRVADAQDRRLSGCGMAPFRTRDSSATLVTWRRPRRTRPAGLASRCRWCARCALTRGQFVLAAKALPGNRYDGHTLSSVAPHVEAIVGNEIKHIIADKGYRGHGAPAPYANGVRRYSSPPPKRQSSTRRKRGKTKAGRR